MNKHILVVFTIDTENLPSNFQDIIKHEQEVIAQWKLEGLVEHLFLRQTKNGAVIVFNENEEEKVAQFMESLPLYRFMKSVEYFHLMKQF
jgi:hypothetical protein